MKKYLVEIIVARYRFGPDYHSEIFDTYEDAKNYIEGVKRDQPRLRSYNIKEINKDPVMDIYSQLMEALQ